MNLRILGCLPQIYKEGESDRLRFFSINNLKPFLEQSYLYRLQSSKSSAIKSTSSSTANNMYTYTPTSKFLVLAPIQSAPLSVTKEQTENVSQIRERSDSESSTASNTQLNRGVARLPAGFLYLGYDHTNGPSPSV